MKESLIVTAPALLAALKDVMELAEGSDIWRPEYDEHPSYKNALAVIANAEGRHE